METDSRSNCRTLVNRVSHHKNESTENKKQIEIKRKLWSELVK